jgi:hypothetical protein
MFRDACWYCHSFFGMWKWHPKLALNFQLHSVKNQLFDIILTPKPGDTWLQICSYVTSGETFAILRSFAPGHSLVYQAICYEIAIRCIFHVVGEKGRHAIVPSSHAWPSVRHYCIQFLYKSEIMQHLISHKSAREVVLSLAWRWLTPQLHWTPCGFQGRTLQVASCLSRPCIRHFYRKQLNISCFNS